MALGELGEQEASIGMLATLYAWWVSRRSHPIRFCCWAKDQHMCFGPAWSQIQQVAACRQQACSQAASSKGRLKKKKRKKAARYVSGVFFGGLREIPRDF
jgi:hypothetical protein